MNSRQGMIGWCIRGNLNEVTFGNFWGQTISLYEKFIPLFTPSSHSLSVSLSLTHTHTLLFLLLTYASLSLSHTLSLSLSLSYTHSLSHSYTLSFTLSLSLSLFLLLTYSSLSLSLFHPLMHTLSLSVISWIIYFHFNAHSITFEGFKFFSNMESLTFIAKVWN